MTLAVEKWLTEDETHSHEYLVYAGVGTKIPLGKDMLSVSNSGSFSESRNDTIAMATVAKCETAKNNRFRLL